VKAHIIPEALSATLSPDKQPLTQRGKDGRYIRRWTSWYDEKLVTADGEAILTGYDTWAIEFFRWHKLIWSSWGPMARLEVPDHLENPGAAWMGHRTLRGINCERLRLFFLSLLWRAAATNLFEFEAVNLPPRELERLRQMVLHGMVEPYNFYPMQLIQLSTKNVPHNRAPLRGIRAGLVGEMAIDPNAAYIGRRMPLYRFYFDGLIIHMEINDDPDQLRPSSGGAIKLGDELGVLTLASERSYEMQHLKTTILEHEALEHEAASKLRLDERKGT
jgi:hypothetical protein